ncbi:diguanylate cyclase domain-containing protein [Sphingomonas sp. M1A8_2b]
MIQRVRIGWLLGLIALVTGLACPAPSHAAGHPLAVCILPAKPGMTAKALFANPAQFDCTAPQSRFGSGDFWVLSQPLPGDIARIPDLGARSASVWQNRLTLFVLYADGAIRRSGFTSSTVGPHLKLGATLSIALPRHDAPPARLLWHVEGAGNLRGVLLGASVATQSEANTSETLMAAIYAAFGGIVLALMIYNLALWGALRQAFQPVYCLMLFCLAAYAFSSSGALGQVMPSLDNNDRLRINVVLLSASAVAVLAFARVFFERRVFAGWLGSATSVVMATIAATSVSYVLIAPSHLHALDRLLSLAYVPLMMLIPAILYRAWRVRSNYLWMFALAWGAPIVFAGMRIASSMGLIAWSFWLDHSTIVSMMLEAMLSSVAIAYRIRLLSLDRDAAREQEIAARVLADTDPLTGLLNRRAFLSRATARTGDQTLLIADIDHFKTVNQAIGHDGGDEVLRRTARALRSAVPHDALVARIGGEEFAILIDAADPVPPDAVLTALRSQRMPHDIAVTASIGRCTGPIANETDWTALYRSADRALFDAKAAGRDRSRDATLLRAA